MLEVVLLPRLSKAASRRRLQEAVKKILVVWNGRVPDLSKSDNNKMLKAIEMIEDVSKKLK